MPTGDRPPRHRLGHQERLAERLHLLAIDTQVRLAGNEDLSRLTPEELDAIIGELRKGEAMTRQLRKRLEALRAEAPRVCPQCGEPVTGRRGAIYCTPKCRVQAHRSAKRQD
jgi:hypothetical protein